MSRPPFGDPGVCPTIVLFSSTTNQSPIGGFFSTTWIRLKSGELREIDVGGGGESTAKSLKRGGGPFFPFVGEGILPDGYLYELNLWKTKPAIRTFGPPVKLFLRLLLAPRRSFHTASRLVRPLRHKI
jgi:hypothetical protein